ncbi:predicted protein [Histoplasma capsulatum var. duboisii H88]|uniref:Predicted protein n=1 Tax=Ajellomyces capsulatus (strain H88) TaxID=544711 RepID=F0UG14_AJEC8|nr:predicted protein [Histoplasma capsulatum var. duboisii H88]
MNSGRLDDVPDKRFVSRDGWESPQTASWLMVMLGSRNLSGDELCSQKTSNGRINESDDGHQSDGRREAEDVLWRSVDDVQTRPSATPGQPEAADVARLGCRDTGGNEG